MVLDPETQKQINDLLSMIINGLASGLLFAVPVVAKMAWTIFRAWTNAKLASIQNQEMREALEFALQRLDKTAETVVSEFEQTSKRNEVGKLLDPAGTLKSAVATIYTQLEPNSRATLERMYGSRAAFGQVIKGKVESKVKMIPRC